MSISVSGAFECHAAKHCRAAAPAVSHEVRVVAVEMARDLVHPRGDRVHLDRPGDDPDRLGQRGDPVHLDSATTAASRALAAGAINLFTPRSRAAIAIDN